VAVLERERLVPLSDGPPPQATLSMPPRPYRTDGSARRWALSRRHPQRGSAARRNSGSRRPRDRRLNLFSERDAGNLRTVFRPPLFRRCRPERAP
jgi:hypothetical protein